MLAATAVVIIVYQLSNVTNLPELLRPISIFEVTFESQFELEEGEVEIETYLPENSEYQNVLIESVASDGLDGQIYLENSGRKLIWSGDELSRRAGYQYQVRTQGVTFNINEHQLLTANNDPSLQVYLKPTEYIQVNHSEIKQLWQQIQPAHQTVYRVLSVIYQYTYEHLKTVPFKGMTDALTALRLGEASCNGKSRLFVALARLNGIPARLVGGLILKSGEKKTSHQWVEVFVDGHWIPFGPTNGYFAERPSHYLKLYQGDEPLFRHTANIGFDYLFKIEKKLMSPAFVVVNDQAETSLFNLASVLSSLALSPQTTAILLLFPLCTLLITFLRNVIGVKTFGIFMPMLIAATCLYTGLVKGLLGFVVIIAIATLFHAVLDRMRVLKTARLASVITLITLCFLLMLIVSNERLRVELGILSLFPIVIITFISERVFQTLQVQDRMDVLMTTLGTMITLLICYFYMQSILIQGLFSYFPALYLLVLAGQLSIGKWSGMRLSELLRFRQPLKSTPNDVLGINARNRNFIYRLNDKSLLKLAADKLATKKTLSSMDIPVADTLAQVSGYGDLEKLPAQLARHKSFVLKPNQGAQGNGIVVIQSRQECASGIRYVSAGGKVWDEAALLAHCKDILSGTYSQTGLPDTAYVEPLIVQDARLNHLADYGLADIRIVVVNGELISAMLRMPTKCSAGKANLHQGAVGVAIDLTTGKTVKASIKGKDISVHPDSEVSLLNFQMPYWTSIKEMARRCYKAIPLGYLGVDIVIDADLGPLVLEVNGRPGLEIQNVHGKGLGLTLTQQPS